MANVNPAPWLVSDRDQLALDRFSDLLVALYRIPLLDDGSIEAAWRTWLGQLGTLLQCNYTVLVLRPPSTRDAGLNIAAGADYDPARDRYNTRYYSMDPFVNLPPGRVVSLAEYASNHPLQVDEFYRVCMQPAHIQHVLGVDLAGKPGLQPGLRLCRPPGGRDFDASERRLIARLVPHLEHALALHQRLNHMDLERGLYAGALTQLAVASILLDGELNLIACNPMAERLLEEGDGLSRTGGALRLSQPRDQQRLRELVAAAAAARCSGAPTLAGAMPVARPSGRAPLGLMVRPLDPEEASRSPSVASVFVTDPERQAEAPTEVLGQLFGLTTAEARLALLLANGLSLEQAAEELNITRNTGRAHLRSIFAKTGVGQQSQLVSLVLRSAVHLS